MKKRLVFSITLIMCLSILLAFPVFAVENNKKVVLIDSCDNGDNWGHIQIDKIDKREGDSCVLAFGTMCLFKQTFSKPINSNIPVESAFLEFWIYLEDPKFLKSEGQIELNSSGKEDTDEFHWNLTDSDLNTGWNYLSLSFADAEKNGNPDINNLKMMRIYQFASKIVYMKIDYITITNEKTIIDNTLLGETKIENPPENPEVVVWKNFNIEKQQAATPYVIGIVVSVLFMLVGISITIVILLKGRKRNEKDYNDNLDN